jgi:hypothetical protein
VAADGWARGADARVLLTSAQVTIEQWPLDSFDFSQIAAQLASSYRSAHKRIPDLTPDAGLQRALGGVGASRWAVRGKAKGVPPIASSSCGSMRAKDPARRHENQSDRRRTGMTIGAGTAWSPLLPTTTTSTFWLSVLIA